MAMTKTVEPTGPAAFLATFAPEGCRDLKHHSCGQRLCPCNEARGWLRTMPRSLSPAAVWERVKRADWLLWLIGRIGADEERYNSVRDQGCDVIRVAFPWNVVVEAIANPPTTMKCDDCREGFPRDELQDGHCEDCDSHYEYCGICEGGQHEDNLCSHLEWSSAASGVVGTGATGADHHKSLDALLGRLGLRRTRALLAALATRKWWRQYDDLGGALEVIRERARDTDDRDGTEVGEIWLRTLGGEEKLRACVETTIVWIDEHLARRLAAIAADRRPRRIVCDGSGRFWVDGSWTAIREQARWMSARRARKVRRALRKVHPGAKIRIVHVLTPAPTLGGSR